MRLIMTKVMGIVNVTPDSFSDGGQFFRPEEAIRRARNLIADGADIIDLGSESTRPGATPLGWEEEWARLEPVLTGLVPQITQSVNLSISQSTNRTILSVDTYHPETAARAIAVGANIINCVRPEPIPEMMKLMEDNAVELVMPWRDDLRRETEDLKRHWNRIYIDPMIGFGTTREEDVALLQSIPELAKAGRVLVGASRKRIVKKLTGEKLTGKNLGGNLGIAVWAAMNGASVVRVHDVRETVQALKVIEALGCSIPCREEKERK